MSKLTTWLAVIALLIAVVTMSHAAYTLNSVTTTLGVLGERLADQDNFI